MTAPIAIAGGPATISGHPRAKQANPPTPRARARASGRARTIACRRDSQHLRSSVSLHTAVFGSLCRARTLSMRQTAARAAIAALVIGGVVVVALALWKLKVLIALLFLAFIISAAMRPSVDWLARLSVPRAAAI